MSGTFEKFWDGAVSDVVKTRMKEDRETIDELELIWNALGELAQWPETHPEVFIDRLASTRERVAVVHRRLKVQFAERYGERL